jgi:hypothetical protein
MASGKQLSFQYGEVSPSLRYRSDAVSYASGLGKLKNMFVRRAGGVSNRPGFEYVEYCSTQNSIPVAGDNMGVKAYTFWSVYENKWKTILYGNYSATSTPYYAFVVDGVGLGIEGSLTLSTATIEGPTPDKLRFTNLKDQIFITPNLEFTAVSSPGWQKVNAAYNIKTQGLENNFGRKQNGVTMTAGSVYGYSGQAPYLPVTYLVTVTMSDGTETFLLVQGTTGYTPGNTGGTATNIHYPTSVLTAYLKINILTALNADAGIKTFNFYRAAGVNGLDSYFKLAGRVKYTQGSGTVIFNDFGADDPSVTPPLDGFDILNISGLTPLKGIKSAAYYQQRLIMAPEAGIADSIKVGDIIASKIGVPNQVVSPLVFNNNDAFKFSIPITDGTPVVAMLAMERLILFTEKGVYVARGAEQGILTPTSVNPLIISQEGCSSNVEPKMSGKRGYFLNNNHTKLMAIEFGIDGNLVVFESSLLSDHFLQEDIVQIEVIGNAENIVYLLRRDGKLVQITVTDDGANGYSLIETDGHIESIYRGKAKRKYPPTATDLDNTEKYYDVLMAYIIRNGQRVLERLTIRDDKNREGEFFADAFGSFGTRLAKYGSGGYTKVTTGGVYTSYNTRINIPTPASWTAGSIIPIWADNAFLFITEEDDKSGVIHFFYDDENGEEQYARYIVQKNSMFSTGNATFPTGWLGYFEVDVPEVLRDVNSQNLSTLEKTQIQTRWLPAIKKIIGFPVNGAAIALMPNPIPFNPSTGYEIQHKPVVVVADGEVLSSPNNPFMPTLYLDSDEFGEYWIDLPDYYSYGYVGIPYESEFETLDLETVGERTLTDSKKLLNAVGVGFMETRGGFYGMPDQDVENMEQFAHRDNSSMNDQTENMNGHLVVNVPAAWTEAGRVNIKQVDPTPMTILSVYPKGISGD